MDDRRDIGAGPSEIEATLPPKLLLEGLRSKTDSEVEEPAEDADVAHDTALLVEMMLDVRSRLGNGTLDRKRCHVLFPILWTVVPPEVGAEYQDMVRERLVYGRWMN